MRFNLKWLLIIFAVTFIFFWKLSLTHQFSILLWSESANQGYSWYHFTAATAKSGSLPLWDPFTSAGCTFIGAMETGAFYPLKAILYFWPFSSSGLFSQDAFHYFYIFSHILAAFFMFLLARELGLAAFPSLVASLTFSLAGFMSKIAWPDMLDSSIWLPLVLLFLVRALNSPRRDRAILWSCVSGLCLGASVLGGRIHMVLMDAIVVLSLTGYIAWRRVRGDDKPAERRSFWLRSLAVVSILAAVSIMFGAIQLLPSIEYGPLAVRYIGVESGVPATQKISYSDLRGELWPRSIMALLIAHPPGSIGNEEVSPYLGIIPLLLTIIGVWRNWHNTWVRYLSVLAVLSFFYCMGSFSFLHGLLYSTVPYLWIGREATRFTYLMHFSMALLAGFGMQSLFERQSGHGNVFGRFVRGLWWSAAIITASLMVPVFYGKPEVNEWVYFSLLFILASVAIIDYISRGHNTSAAAFALTAILLSDFNGSYWHILNIKNEIRSGGDYLHKTLLPSRSMAEYLKNRPGIFRVRMDMDIPPNIGNLYGVQITDNTHATELVDFADFRNRAPRAYDLLNVRYTVKRSSATDPGPVYQDELWKVYENGSYLPRAWIVRKTSFGGSHDEVFQKMGMPGFDPRRQAIVDDQLQDLFDSQHAGPDAVKIDSYEPQRIGLSVQADASGLLVLSEMDYPGWRATVNGIPTRIHKVNGLLRGVIVPAGSSRVEFRYTPRSVLLGAILTCFAPLATIAFALFIRRKSRKTGIAPSDALWSQANPVGAEKGPKRSV